MTISHEDLAKMARLAYLNTDSSDSSHLEQEVSSIMDFVEQLCSVDTYNTEPLFHPFDLHQRQRNDEVTEEECIAELETIAPLFKGDLYLVPKVIESGK